MTGEEGASITAGELMAAIDHTIFAAGKETTRFAFNGIFLKPVGDKLVAAATDGRRLAIYESLLASLNKKAPQPLDNPIIPVRAAKILRVLLADDPEAIVKLYRDGGRLSMDVGGSILTTALVEGTFPPYEEVIPKAASTTITVERDSLLASVKRAALLTDDDSKGVKFGVTKSGIKLESRNPEDGEAEVNLPCKVEGQTVEIAFNPIFIADGLCATADAGVRIELTAANRPGTR